MKTPIIRIGLIILLLTNCNFKRKVPEMIDSISFDATKDNPEFNLCHDYIFQYFNDGKGLIYEGEKPLLDDTFFNKYNAETVPKQSGLIRIRFIVNCKGETDRFRLLGMDNDYNEKIFDKSITNQLLNITKQLKGWGVKKFKEQPIDYYQYLIFVLKDGKIIKILP